MKTFLILMILMLAKTVFAAGVVTNESIDSVINEQTVTHDLILSQVSTDELKVERQ